MTDKDDAKQSPRGSGGTPLQDVDALVGDFMQMALSGEETPEWISDEQLSMLFAAVQMHPHSTSILDPTSDVQLDTLFTENQNQAGEIVADEEGEEGPNDYYDSYQNTTHSKNRSQPPPNSGIMEGKQEACIVRRFPSWLLQIFSGVTESQLEMQMRNFISHGERILAPKGGKSITESNFTRPSRKGTGYRRGPYKKKAAKAASGKKAKKLHRKRMHGAKNDFSEDDYVTAEAKRQWHGDGPGPGGSGAVH